MNPIPFPPTFNASLNCLCLVLLVSGYVLIRHGHRKAHEICMLAACTASVVFLISYLIYHFEVGATPFSGEGTIRVVYFAILISHTILAAAIIPMIVMTLRRGLRGDFPAHKRIARRTLPIWLYVSSTGVIVYWMLYRL